MSKIISIIGGSGYVGSRCIQTLLTHCKDIKIYSISRSTELHKVQTYEDRVEYIRGDAMEPESFSPYLEKSTGIIHTIGKLISTSTDKDDSYDKVNYESAMKVAKIADSLGTLAKKNFVFISAERGMMFPLSLAFSGYIDSKRKAEEKLLNDFPNLNPVILRPGLINDSKERPYLLPLAYAFDLSNFLEKNVLNSIAPNLGDKLGLPAASIQLDTLCLYAAAGALGKLDMRIYSNDYMNDLNNLNGIRFDV
jgi:nucleoside-diphosphate-sugar epimerase